jgi:hypothetical protein
MFTDHDFLQHNAPTSQGEAPTGRNRAPVTTGAR